MPNTIKLRIEGEGSNLQAFDEATHKIEGMTEAAHEFVETLKMGVGIDLGGRIVEGIAEIPNVLREAIAEGVKFNAELETMRLTLAGMAKQFSEGGITTFNQGLQVSDMLIGKMRDRANELGLSFEALMETYKTSAGALFHGGVTDLEKQLDLVVLLSRAMQGMGISGFQATRDTQDILMGMADRTKAGRELGVKDADINQAKEQGQLYEYLSEKLSGFTEAGTAGTHTLTAEMARLHNEIQGIEAEISKPIFEALKDGLAVLNTELQKPETVGNLKALGFEVAEIVKSGMSLLDWAVRNVQMFEGLATSAGLLAVAFAGLKIAQLAQQLGMWTAGIAASESAIDAETSSVIRNTLAHEANAAARATEAASASAGMASLGLGAMPSRQEWLNQQRTLRPGGTTYASYESNAIGGVVTGAVGSAAKMGLGGAVEGASAGGVAGVAATIGSTIAGLLRGAIYIELFMKVGELINALNQLRVVNAEAVKVAKADDRKVNDRILEKFQELAKNGMPEGRADFEARLGAERSRLEGLAARETDPNARVRLVQDKARLEGVGTDFEINSKRNYEAATKDREASDREDRAKEKQDREIAHLLAREEAKRTEQVVGDASLDLRVGDAQNPEEKLKLLREKESRARAELKHDAITTDNIDPLSASPVEISKAAGNAVDEGTRDKMLADAKKIEEIQREINRLTDENEKQIEEVCNAEAEHAALADKARKTMTEEREVLSALAAGQFDVAAAAERRKQIEGEIDKLVKENVPAIEAREIAEKNAALKLEATRAKTLQDLQEEHALSQAKLSGDQQLVDLLTRQRDIRREIESLEKSGLTATEAKAQAEQAANDRHQLELAKRNEELDKVKADVAVQSARTPAQRQKAELDKLRTDSYYELKGKGIPDDQANDIIGDRMDNFRRQNRGRTIGGPTTRSAEDHLGDRLGDDAWKDQFKPRGGAAAAGSILDDRPGSAPASPLDRALGKTSDQAWDDIFKRGVGPHAPQPPSRMADELQGPPMPDNAKVSDKGGGADKLGAGADKLKDGSQKMDGAADKITSAASSITAAAGKLGGIGETIKTAFNGLKQEIDDLQQQINDLQNS